MRNAQLESANIGELLVAAGLITHGSLNETIKSFAPTRMPVGKMLIEAGTVTNDDLDTASKLDMIMRATSLSLAIAAQAFRYVKLDNLSLIQALGKAGIEGQIVSYSRLGLLLVDSNLISKSQFEEALKSSKDTGIQVGRMLCLMGLLDPNLLDFVLKLQQDLRNTDLTKDAAIKELRAFIAARDGTAETDDANDAETKEPHREIRLIELLVMSNVITESELLNSVERAIAQNAEAAKLLVDGDLIREPVLETALELLAEVNKGNIPVTAAQDVLSYISSVDKSQN